MGAKIKWTKQAIIDDARKYSTKVIWQENNESAYKSALKNGWLNEATSHMVSNVKRWTKEEIVEDALKYKTKSDWRAFSKQAYQVAVKRGWRDDACLHMESRYQFWTEKMIIEEALKYNTRKEWEDNSPRSYDRAKYYGIIEMACAHMTKIISFGEKIISEFLLSHDIEFETQKTYKDLRFKYPLRFDFYIPIFNLLVEFHGIQHEKGWNQSKESADYIKKNDDLKKEYASVNRINYIAIFASEVNSASDIEAKLMSKFIELAKLLNLHMNFEQRKLSKKEQDAIKNIGILTKEVVLNRASAFSSINEWLQSDSGGYAKARKMGWYDEAIQHMERNRKPRGYWTKDRVMESAKKYELLVQWRQHENSAYVKAKVSGWLQEATAHMIKRIKSLN